ncbi:MAG: hypothetical protein ABR543_04490 [Gemmatimonadaceae bacterium]
MIARLAVRNLALRPWRSLLLLLGYGLGVGVMIVLLAIGEALMTQARDEKLVGGGSITVLPEGIDIEVMKTGGLGGMFFSIDRARFIYRQLLAAPRQAHVIKAAAPQLEGKLAYLRVAGGGEERLEGQEYAVRASGEIPSRNSLVGASPEIVAGEWRDDENDRRWMAPTAFELRTEIDRFHHPPAAVKDRASWGEWHYFNVLSADANEWAFISLIVAGDVTAGEWGGQVAITLRELGGRTHRFVSEEQSSGVKFSTADADVRIGNSSVTLQRDGSYRIEARAKHEGGGTGGEIVTVDLVLTPGSREYFPGAVLATGEFTSGYAVAGLRAVASGTICVGQKCESYEKAQAYHDHNWGVWRGVSWDWGATRAGEYTLLYGRVQSPDSDPEAVPIFVYLVDSLGFLAIFRPDRIHYQDGRTITVGREHRQIRVPSSMVVADARGDDTLRVEIDIQDAIGTDTREPLAERGDLSASRTLGAPYFLQMKGIARITGRVAGKVLSGAGHGFFETFR